MQTMCSCVSVTVQRQKDPKNMTSVADVKGKEYLLRNVQGHKKNRQSNKVQMVSG